MQTGAKTFVALVCSALTFCAHAQETLSRDGPNHNGVLANLNGMKEILGGVEATFQAVCLSSGQTKIDGGAKILVYYRVAGGEVKQKESDVGCASHSNDVLGRSGTKIEGGPQVAVHIPDVRIADRGKKFEVSAVAWLKERKAGTLEKLDEERLKLQKQMGM